MVDIDLLIAELNREQRRNEELEEGRRLRLPLPKPSEQPRINKKEPKQEPKRVIIIEL